MPDRRQAIADLRVDGTGRGAIFQMVVSQGLLLGIAASLVGLLGGWALSGAFHQSPGYLSRSFTLGTGTVIGLEPVLLALACGLAAACCASIVPLLDLRAGRALDAAYGGDGAPGNGLSETLTRRAAVGSGLLLLAATVLFVLARSAAIEVCVLLALATMLAVPLALAGVLATAGAAAARYRGLTLTVAALTSLRATTLSSLALAATGAVALFGSVALGGSRADLLRGIDGYSSGYVAGASIWVVNPHDNQAIDDFIADGHASAIARLRGVQSVSVFQGSFLNLGERRLWVIAWPRGAPLTLLSGQIDRRPGGHGADTDPARWLDRGLGAVGLRTPHRRRRQPHAGHSHGLHSLPDRGHDHEPRLAPGSDRDEHHRLQPRMEHERAERTRGRSSTAAPEWARRARRSFALWVPRAVWKCCPRRSANARSTPPPAKGSASSARSPACSWRPRSSR